MAWVEPRSRLDRENYGRSYVSYRESLPSIDEMQRALNLMRGLSIDDFDEPGLRFESDGSLIPVDRGPVQAHQLVVTPD